LGGYLWISQFNNMRKMLLFLSGLVVAVIALAIPLGPAPQGFVANALSCCLPGGTLFSLHMLRHILLLMVAPPLLIAALPEEPVKRFVSNRRVKPWFKKFTSPYVTWIVGVGAMWFWHVPFIYNYMATYGTSLGHLILPRVEVVSLIIAGGMLAWPVLSPVKEQRLHPLKGSAYLFLACVGCSILGMSIAFASTGYFQTAFASQPGPIWGLTQKGDQAIGGLLMWVPGCFIYVAGVMTLIARWAYQLEHPSYNRKPAYTAQEIYDEDGQTEHKKHTNFPPVSTPEIAAG
jgi:cytochrome c oxidase assembly factor CtaG